VMKLQRRPATFSITKTGRRLEADGLPSWPRLAGIL
jgi:hypothetical protein